MFDIGFLELVLVGIVALLVLGPERLPHAARMTGAFLGRMTRMVQSVREEVEREINVYEMQERIKRQVENGMIGDLRKELSEAQKAIQEGFNATAKPDTPSNEPPALIDPLSELLPDAEAFDASAPTVTTSQATATPPTPVTSPSTNAAPAPAQPPANPAPVMTAATGSTQHASAAAGHANSAGTASSAPISPAGTPSGQAAHPAAQLSVSTPKESS